MPRARRRPRSVRKSRNTNIIAEERKYARAPHSFVFARPNVGSLVKQLALDARRIFEPYTASQLKVTKKNVLKDFINIAGPLNVSHILYFTHPRPEKLALKRSRYAANLEKKREKLGVVVEEKDDDTGEQKGSAAGGVYLHVIRSPSGPSLTFRVSEYSLTRDVFSLVRRVFDVRQFASPPLLAMTGFGSSTSGGGPPPPHLRLLVDMFQNMLPSLNIQKLKLSSVRRVLLLSREVDNCQGEDVVYVRHFNIRIENRSVSKALRRLGVGGAPLRKKKTSFGGLGPEGSGKSTGVPSLGKYATIDDYLSKASLLTDSGMSDLDDMAEVDLPVGSANENDNGESLPKTSKKSKEALAEAKAAHGFTHLTGCRKATIRLTEIGPRLTLKLIKIEDGVNSGNVLYHSWRKLSPTEVSQQEALRNAKAAAKAARKQLQEQRRIANECARASNREACLEGMRRAGQIPLEGAASLGAGEANAKPALDDANSAHQSRNSDEGEDSNTHSYPIKTGSTRRKSSKEAAKKRHKKSHLIVQKAKMKKQSHHDRLANRERETVESV
ncbi:unnamed protein product [Mesocestoides corti]|uniref:Brix domain-containing protein n=1 Tax=Mesocestoides corti TaxID=53468 RepID=A0A0R3UID6_MESCO|nr:unnamed protein product [Mesocestoides corti]